jgi:hypothetical protein
VRDSAGIRIVENAGPAWGEDDGWRLSAGPALDIGEIEGEPDYELFGVQGALRLSSGRFVIANGGTSQLRYYDSRGFHLFDRSRHGAGPGEFEGMGQPRLFGGDSLSVQDYRLGRISVFTHDGTFVRSFFTEDTERRYQNLGHFGDSTLLLAGSIGFAGGLTGTGVLRDSVLYVRRRSDGLLLDEIGMFPWQDRFITFAPNTGVRSVTSIPFGKEAQVAVGPDGFYFGTSDTFEFLRYDRGGRLEAIVRFAGSTLALGPGDIDRYVDDALARMSENSGANLERFWRNRYDITPFPEAAPAYQGFILDADGNLWVEAYRRPWETTARYTVFDPQGRLLGDIETPDGFTVYQIGRDFLLGKWRDGLDVEHVLMYSLIKDR